MTPADATATSVEIYTDGACIGNPGRGGYGAVILGDGKRRELSAGFRLTTNNRMELLGAIEALAALAARSTVTLHSDSSYVVRGMNEGWARKWQAKHWYRTKTQRAVNPDLWQRLLELAEKHDVTFRWVPGHAGVRENERCDRLAVTAASGTDLAPDIAYEASLVRDKPAPTRPSLL